MALGDRPPCTHTPCTAWARHDPKMGWMHNMESGVWIDEFRIVVRSRSSPFSSLRSYPVQPARFAPVGDATTCIFLGGQAYRYLCRHTLILVKLGQGILEHIVVEHIVEHVGTYRTPAYFTLV
jgi:hypothetical protein